MDAQLAELAWIFWLNIAMLFYKHEVLDSIMLPSIFGKMYLIQGYTQYTHRSAKGVGGPLTMTIHHYAKIYCSDYDVILSNNDVISHNHQHHPSFRSLLTYEYKEQSKYVL